MSKNPRIGGSFAPPLTDERLAAYRTLIDGVEQASPVRDVLEELYRCAAAWWEQPESTGVGRVHPSGAGLIVNLDAPVAKSLWDVVPWPHECNAMAGLLDGLPTGELRNAAFHLLWFARELTLDREPITTDKLPPK